MTASTNIPPGQRVAIVTGGARGIGAAITTLLARSGVHVAAGYSANSSAAEELAGKLGAEGASVSVHQGNVGKPADCERVVSEVLEQKGCIDYLVNNAGITVDKTVRKMTVDDWHAVMEINLSGAFYMCKALLDHMVANGAADASSTSPRSSARPAPSGKPTTRPPRPACSVSEAASPSRWRARASPSTASPRATWRRRWWPPCPSRCSTKQLDKICRSSGSARSARWPGRCMFLLDDDAGLHHRFGDLRQRRAGHVGHPGLRRSSRVGMISRSGACGALGPRRRHFRRSWAATYSVRALADETSTGLSIGSAVRRTGEGSRADTG